MTWMHNHLENLQNLEKTCPVEITVNSLGFFFLKKALEI